MLQSCCIPSGISLVEYRSSISWVLSRILANLVSLALRPPGGSGETGSETRPDGLGAAAQVGWLGGGPGGTGLRIGRLGVMGMDEDETVGLVQAASNEERVPLIALTVWGDRVSPSHLDVGDERFASGVLGSTGGMSMLRCRLSWMSSAALPGGGDGKENRQYYTTLLLTS